MLDVDGWKCKFNVQNTHYLPPFYNHFNTTAVEFLTSREFYQCGYKYMPLLH